MFIVLLKSNKKMRILIASVIFVVFSTGDAQLSQAGLQQCAADLACSMNYSAVFQTKLDNISNYMDLQVAQMRLQMNGTLQPLEAKVNLLEKDTAVQVSTIFDHLRAVENELVYDRQYLSNVEDCGINERLKMTIKRKEAALCKQFRFRQYLSNVSRGLHILNDEYRKEALDRSHDVHQLELELSKAKNSMAQLQDAVNSLLAKNSMQTIQVVSTPTPSSPVAQGCADKDLEISELKHNLTFYQNAYTTSQKTSDNLRQLQAMLQSQVNELKVNVTSLESTISLKNQLIIQLQQQQQPGSGSIAFGSCTAPLGMKDGSIPDRSITSSESQPGRGPENARLDNGQGWYTNEKQDSRDYLQVDLGGLFYITKIATQGAPCCDVMVTNYTLQYSKDGVTWKDYQDDCSKTYFRGNTDSTTVVTHILDSPIRAQYVRYNIKDFKRDGVSNYVGMRAELYGCSA